VGKPEVLVSFPQEADGASREDSLWREHQRPNTTKILHFIGPDGNPDWAGEDDAGLGRRIGAFRHLRSRPAGRGRRMIAMPASPAGHGGEPPCGR
jgi:hypothetical protein